MIWSTLLHPELILRVLKFTLAVSINGLNQYVLETFDSRKMRAFAAIALLALMQVIIMIPLNSLVLKTHPELRNFVLGFDAIDVVLLVVGAALATREIKYIDSAVSAGLVASSKATAIKTSAGITWVCVAFSVFLVAYAFHEIGKFAKQKDDLDCESVAETKVDFDSVEKEAAV